MSKKEIYDKLTEVMGGISPEQLQVDLVKSEMIAIRLTPTDKATMQQTAKACKLTMTEYLTKLHHIAMQRLAQQKRKKR